MKYQDLKAENRDLRILLGLAEGVLTNVVRAAPDLYQALSELVRINEEHNAAVAAITGRPVGWKDTYLDRARAALTKARGES